MAETNVNIGAKITVDSDAAIKQTLLLKDNIKNLSTEFKQAKAGSDEQVAAYKKLTAAQNELNNTNKDSNTGFGILKDKIQGLVPGLKTAESGAISFGTQLKALAANPLILILTGIVLVLTFLYEAFTSTSAGAKKFEQVFSGIKAAVQVVIDRVFALGNAVIKFFSGDFKGAIADAKAAVSGVGDEIEKVYNRTAAITKRLQEIKKAEREDKVDKSEREKRLALLREQLNDESVSIAERKKIAKELRDDQMKNAAEDLARTKEKAALKIEQFKMEREGEKKHADEIAELQIEINNTEKENALEGVRTNKVIRNLDKQEKAKETEEAKAAAEKRKADLQSLREFELKDLKQKQEIELAAITDAKLKEFKVIENAYQDELRANRLAVEEKKLTQKQADLLNTNALVLANQKRESLQKKFDDESKAKEKQFQLELNQVALETRLAGITDARERERVQLEVSYEAKLKQAKEKYKDNAAQLAQIEKQIDEQQRLAKKALEKKFDDEDIKSSEALSFKKIAFELSQAKKNLSQQAKLLDQKTELIKAQYRREISEAGLTAAKKADIEQKYTEDIAAQTEARKQLAKAEMKAKIDAADSIASTLDNASNLLGKATVAGKILSAASATISTFTSAQKAYEATVGIPVVGPVLAPINAGLAVAAGIANVQKILSVDVPGQASGGGSSPSASIPSAPVQPKVQTTQLNQNSINAFGNAAVGKTYVLDSDITSNKERLERITRAARI